MPDGKLLAVLQVELGEHVRDMRLDGLGADADADGNFGVGATLA